MDFEIIEKNHKNPVFRSCIVSFKDIKILNWDKTRDIFPKSLWISEIYQEKLLKTPVFILSDW